MGTAAKWNMVMGGNNCSAATMTIDGTGITTTTCLAATYNPALSTGVTSSSWFQPKETSTKVYTTLTRFSAKESATWTGMAADSKKNATGCTAKALTGASPSLPELPSPSEPLPSLSEQSSFNKFFIKL